MGCGAVARLMVRTAAEVPTLNCCQRCLTISRVLNSRTEEKDKNMEHDMENRSSRVDRGLVVPQN